MKKKEAGDAFFLKQHRGNILTITVFEASTRKYRIETCRFLKNM